ncbi:MAG TPA: hypothetical protein VLE97_11310 [Gaiellaceae bacterium]|nr:hypothetical protein [Gaiellaceae bacterium]
MSDLDDAIKIGELVVKTAEALFEAIDKAKGDLAANVADLKKAIADAKKEGRDDLAADRKEADDALDKKFDHEVGDEDTKP